MTKKILVTGGEGRFAKILKKQNKKLNLVEVIELKNHPWFIGTQYHPEYRSRVLKPHPLFISFVKKIKSIKNG